MKNAKKLLFSLLLISFAGAGLLVSGCATLTSAAGAMGVEAPKTEEVELSVGKLCPTCSAKSHKTINPFPEPVKYTKVGIPDIDSFNESANNLYGSVMLVEKMIDISEKMAADPNMAVEGFGSPKDVLSLAKGMFETASTDAPNLLTQGQSIVTDVSKFADPSKALVLPQATDQVVLSIERLNIAQEKLTTLAGKMTDAAGMEEAPAE